MQVENDFLTMEGEGIDVAIKKQLKTTRMSTTTKGNHSHHHKKPRRSTRPVISKGPKSAAREAENAAKVVAETHERKRLLHEKLRLLEKLTARHEKAGKNEDAEESRQKIESAKGELHLLDMDLQALANGPKDMVDGDVVEE